MTRRIIRIMLLLLAAFSASGCTRLLLDEVARKPVVTEYSVAYVDSAWRGDDGALAVCFHGWLNAGPEAGPPVLYTMTMRAGALQELAVPEGTAGDARNILAWRAGSDDMQPGCRELPELGVPLEVNRFSAPAAENGVWTRRPLYELLEPVDPLRPDPVVHSIDRAEEQALGVVVYQHDAPLAGGARFVRLDPMREESYEYNAAIFLIPVTIAVDVTIFVALVYLCVQAPGSC